MNSINGKSKGFHKCFNIPIAELLSYVTDPIRKEKLRIAFSPWLPLNIEIFLIFPDILNL